MTELVTVDSDLSAEELEAYRKRWRPAGAFVTDDGPEFRWIIGDTVVNISLGNPPGSDVQAYVFDRAQEKVIRSMNASG